MLKPRFANIPANKFGAYPKPLDCSITDMPRDTAERVDTQKIIILLVSIYCLLEKFCDFSIRCGNSISFRHCIF